METLSGTEWVNPEQGSSILILAGEIVLLVGQKHPAMIHLDELAKKHNGNILYTTNLKFIGHPLSDEDLKNIAECE